MRWLVAVAVLVSAPARSDPRIWAIDPPAGWQEDAARAEDLREIHRLDRQPPPPHPAVMTPYIHDLARSERR
jgi:hypothetical protein